MWLDVEYPPDGLRIADVVELVELKGWAGTSFRGGHDVVLILDRSVSAWRPSGADVDGDGQVGTNRPEDEEPHQRWTTDPGDTIFQAELAAARQLVQRFDESTTRMGIVSFAGRAVVRAELGTPRAGLLRALDGLPKRADPMGTHMSSAIKRAVTVLAGKAPDPDRPELPPVRQRTAILLSDGIPTVPGPADTAQLFALQAAKRAAEAHVRIYAFALGPLAVGQPEVFEQIARRTGGELFLLNDPGEVVDYAPYISLSGVESVVIENLTKGSKARAVRLFPDGTFDAYAPLVEGANVLRISATGEDRGVTHVERTVHFRKVDIDTPERRARMQERLRDLKIRTLEMELAARAREGLAARRKSLAVEVER